MHQKGMEYIFKGDLTEVERMAELEVNIARGNHSTVESKPKELEKKVDREVTFGFCTTSLAVSNTKNTGSIAPSLWLSHPVVAVGDWREDQKVLTHT
mmetsp:Transcript_42028/g.48575  ORF Transcript_42028/g.48575 Transcript_42028/m.48575 type:complete len:97 (-) Transcript_42028:116-406(-)